MSRFQPSLSPSDESTPPPRRRRAGEGEVEGAAADAMASTAAAITHLRIMTIDRVRSRFVPNQEGVNAMKSHLELERCSLAL